MRTPLPPRVIGMVHFPPLIGREGAVSFAHAQEKARRDLDVLLASGIPAVMFENMYDFPHTERLDDERREAFRGLLAVLTDGLRIPFGLSVLWNDYVTAFALARDFGASWIRVPVFVDSVATQFGIFHADPDAVCAARARANAVRVHIYADIQVKHAQMLTPRPLVDSARAAAAAGADAIIVTGTWTGEPPSYADVASVRMAVRTPILIGSGMTECNVATYTRACDGFIVGTSLKYGGARPPEHERLRTSWDTPVDAARVCAFLQAVCASQ